MKTQFKNYILLLEHFKDEATCHALLEKQRWNGNPICPHCKHDKVYRTNRGFKCANKDCHKKFSVTVGTIFENSKIPLRYWFAAIYIATAHKKGISSHQLSRDLGITQKTAWFILQRVREMLKVEAPNMVDGTVELDETGVGGKERNKHKKIRKRENKGTGFIGKTMVFGVLQRAGNVWTKIVPDTTGKTLKPIIKGSIGTDVTIITDGAGAYSGLNKEYHHEVVYHEKDEYVRGEYHTNGIEGYWSLLKRGIIGIYHNVSPKHLHRYCDEFSYRYNTRKIKDCDRFVDVLTKVSGTRITYNKLTKNTDESKKA
ncbi:MAG TPA: IS1595 family transposase [Bacteroidia bacterium]|jgi:transposase-like protein|nr:IS1595 family transposase [Bacteroidia bacterium]